MKKSLFFALALALLPFLSNSNLYSAEAAATPAPADAEASDTNAPDPAVDKDLVELIGRINQKIQAEKTNESDYAENMKEFDGLLVKHKDAPAKDRAEILMRKASFYLQVMRMPEKALPIFEQIKKDFPSVQLNGSTDEIITALKGMVEKKKIRDELAPGAPFPDFKESDLEGHDLSISKYKGKVVLVDFWATWCPPCIVKVPEIVKTYNKYHDKGFEVVGISLDEEKDKLETFIKQRKMPWPEFFDGKRWDNKLAVKYGIDQTPTTYLIGRDGKIIALLDGTEDLDEVVGKAMKP